MLRGLFRTLGWTPGSPRSGVASLRRLLLAGPLAALLLIPAAQASTGALDPSFGAGGKVTTAIGPGDDFAWAVVLQPDGKLVAAGESWNGTNDDFALARYTADGSPDASFGAGGKVTTAIGLGFDEAYALARQPDGKLVAAGLSYNGANYDFALARYHADGTLDAGFGAGGKVTTAIGSSDDYALALAVQPDGKIVAAGESRGGSQGFFALARYNSDGSLDTSFNGTGIVLTAIGSGSGAVALVLQPDGKLVAAGWCDNGFALARYNPDGSLDTSFNGTGKVTTAIGSGVNWASALVVRPDGRLVAAGISHNGTNYDFALARYNPNGTLDAGFGAGGKVTTALGPGDDYAYGLVLQPDGRLVAAGRSSNGTDDDFALARYNPNGTLDAGFGAGGKVTTALGSGDDYAYGLLLQPDGKLVAAGNSHNGSNLDFALVRHPGGTAPKTCVVPKLKGKTLKAAERALTKARCSLGKVSRAYSARVSKGRVISPKPKAGVERAAGARVALEVSRGKRP